MIHGDFPKWGVLSFMISSLCSTTERDFRVYSRNRDEINIGSLIVHD